MLLYLYPGACSLAVHIALIEAGLPYESNAIDHSKKTKDGRNYLTINPRGFVPALQLENGTVLTETLAILAYIAGRNGDLFPSGESGRWLALEALSYMVTTIHGGLNPFFKKASDIEKDTGRKALAKGYAFLEDQLGERSFLLGNAMSIADPYLFWSLLWSSRFDISVPERLRAFFDRMSQEPSVIQALAEEGL